MRVDPPAATVGELLSRLGAESAASFSRRVSALGLSPAQVAVLRAVAEKPGGSQQALAAHLGAVPSRIVALLDDLTEARLVERRRSPADRRLNELHLTASGRRRLRDLDRVTVEHDEALCDGLDAAERAHLQRLLSRLVELRAGQRR
ncbi:MAG: MarR family transcriptional regulator [Actinomycetota bacterium]|nr:MarR family transcriptional regulator [Actinomycetota bacterium]